MATDEQVRDSLILLFDDARQRQMWDLTEIYAFSAIRIGFVLIQRSEQKLAHQRKRHHD